MISLLITLTLVCATSHMAYRVKGQGPSAQGFTMIKYAHADSDEDRVGSKDESKEDEFWKESHEAVSLILMILILLHITGAYVSSKLHHENLVKAVITGNKEKKG